jgi:hypothetical protein
MTIQTLPMAVLMPPVLHNNGQATAAGVTMVTAMTFDGAGDRLALITWVTKTGLLTDVRFRTGTVTTAGATFQIQIEGVDGSGNPDGTAKYANANGTVVVSTSDDSVWKTVPINGGTGVTVTKGDLIAIVLTVSSGTPNAVIIAGAPTTAGWVYGNMPYLVQDTGGGSWARLASASTAWCLTWEIDGELAMIPGGTVAHSMTFQAVGNGAERGMRILAPWPMRVIGMRARMPNLAAGGDFRVRLYDSDGTTVLAESINSSTDIDGDVVSLATQDNFYDVFFPESPTLSAGAVYFLAIWQTTANAVNLHEIGHLTAGYMAALPCGAEWYRVSRGTAGSGAFAGLGSDTRAEMHLWVDGFDDGAGSGGGGGPLVGGRLVA